MTVLMYFWLLALLNMLILATVNFQNKSYSKDLVKTEKQFTKNKI